MKKNFLFSVGLLMALFALVSCGGEKKNETVPPSNAHEYVDLGLLSGIMRATSNVGATKPKGYGGDYAWDEIEERKNDGGENYKWNKGGDTISKCCTSRSIQILIKSDKKGNSIDEQMENFANMGFRSSTNAYNEIYIFKAPETTIETARRLKLNVEYSKSGEYYPITLYGKSVPVFVEFCDINEQERAGLDIEVRPDSTFIMSNFNGKTIAGQRTVKGKFTSNPQTFVATPVGTVALSYNPAYTIRTSVAYTVKHIDLSSAASKHIGKLNYTLDENDNNLITITTNDHSIERADDILRTIVDVCNENWVKDKNKAARETKEFIDTRLGYISNELDEIESGISVYKRLLSREEELKKQRASINKELEFLKTLQNETKEHVLLPLNPDINNKNILSLIQAYNDKMLERNKLVSNSSENNPIVKDMDNELSSMKKAIVSSVNSHINIATTNLQSTEKELKNLQSEIAKNPKHKTFLESTEREQSVKENIYLFLLQKREENQLSQEFTPNRIRILAPPSGSYEPTARREQEQKQIEDNISKVFAKSTPESFAVSTINVDKVTNKKETDGVSFGLEGREVIGGLVKPEYTEQNDAIVVVDIIVNPDGDVVSAEINSKKAFCANKALRENARRAAIQTKFNKVDSKENQRGSITYKFEILY